ncbi:hypothetical protein GCM10022214_86510 [Actinomadura miaoliensis]|uniref:Uncharacterized protein n=1 Tax=Actinomadura miaoliensis TaxID=430685 RepID=A0ABP7X8Y4_9ACTN
MPSTAAPSALPNCWTAVSVPLADPVSCGSTPDTTMSKNGAISRPMPMPQTSRAGVSCHGPTPVPAMFRVSATAATPAAMMAVPPWMTGRPNRCTACATPNPAMMPSDHGTWDSPAFSGE